VPFFEIFFSLPVQAVAAHPEVECQRTAGWTGMLPWTLDDVEILDLLVKNSQERVSACHNPSRQMSM